MTFRPATLAAAAALLALTGCANLLAPKVEIAEPTMARPQPLPVAPPSAAPSGSIFQSAQYRPLFEDHRARLVGDTITVQIVEKVSATQSSTSTVDKNGSVKAGITALPFLSAGTLNRLNATGSTSNTFEGKGTTENSNNFSGTMTATVIEVLDNGHLVVAGEKQVGVNHNVDVLRFSGQIDPRTIQPGNKVASAQIANVRIESRGRGQQDDAQAIGWLARFFLSVLPI